MDAIFNIILLEHRTATEIQRKEKMQRIVMYANLRKVGKTSVILKREIVGNFSDFSSGIF